MPASRVAWTDPLLHGRELLRSATRARGGAAADGHVPARHGGDGAALRMNHLAIDAESIAAAAERIAPYANRTPVLTSNFMDREVGARCFFKCENFQKVGAFKFRGACNAVFATDASVECFVTESSGNHGQALSLACKLRGKKSVIVVPKDAPKVKVNAMRDYGAQLEFVDFQDRKTASERVRNEQGAALIHPYDDPRVMSGQGTCMLELWSQVLSYGVAQLDVVVTPVGGGGLLSGVAVAAKLLNPDAVVIGAEPALADDASRSKATSELQGHRNGQVPKTLADGLRTTLGENTWPVIRDVVDGIIVVEEKGILAAMSLVYERMKIVIEPSSAVAVAAVLSDEFRRENAGKNVGIVLTGGNVDLSRYFDTLAARL